MDRTWIKAFEHRVLGKVLAESARGLSEIKKREGTAVTTCSVCERPLPPGRQGEQFLGGAPKLCGEVCLGRAVDVYWARQGARAQGVMVSLLECGTVYRLRSLRSRAGEQFYFHAI